MSADVSVEGTLCVGPAVAILASRLAATVRQVGEVAALPQEMKVNDL